MDARRINLTKPLLAHSKRIDQWNNTRVYEIEGKEYPSVTSIIGLLDKPALISWAAKLSAEYAVAHLDAIALLPAADAINLVKRNWRGERDRSADFGTYVHDLIDQDIMPATDTKEYGYVAAAATYMDDQGLTPVAQERTIVNKQAGYAGTADLFAVQENRLIVSDWKTGNGLYESAAMQLVALANATHYADENGNLVAIEEYPDEGHAVRLHPAGYELRTVDMGGENAQIMFAAFVSLIDVWRMKVHNKYWDKERT